jgi:hypothetical protein
VFICSFHKIYGNPHIFSDIFQYSELILKTVCCPSDVVIHFGINFRDTVPPRLITFKPLKIIETVSQSPLGSIHYQKCMGRGHGYKVVREANNKSIYTYN